jgi:hypothetical protein
MADPFAKAVGPSGRAGPKLMKIGHILRFRLGEKGTVIPTAIPLLELSSVAHS